MQPCSFVLQGPDPWSVQHRQQLLKPLAESIDFNKADQTVTLRAEVQQDFWSYKKGQLVQVQLDLFGQSTMKLACEQEGRQCDTAATGMAVQTQLATGLEAAAPVAPGLAPTAANVHTMSVHLLLGPPVRCDSKPVGIDTAGATGPLSAASANHAAVEAQPALQLVQRMVGAPVVCT